MVDLNLGNLSQNDWQSVVDSVNIVLGDDVKFMQTYVSSSQMSVPFVLPMKKEAPNMKKFTSPVMQSIELPVKRKVPNLIPIPVVDASYIRMNYSAVAAAGAADGEDGDNVENSDSSEEETEEGSDGDGMRRLVRAIEKLGKTYERVERDKQRLKIELEKQKMQFTKEMEIQKMQLFMDTQIQLQKIKRAKRFRSNNFCS